MYRALQNNRIIRPLIRRLSLSIPCSDVDLGSAVGCYLYIYLLVRSPSLEHGSWRFNVWPSQAAVLSLESDCYQFISWISLEQFDSGSGEIKKALIKAMYTFLELFVFLIFSTGQLQDSGQSEL